MGVAHLFRIGDQLIGSFPVRIIGPVFVTAPGTQLDFINIHRRCIRVGAAALRKPLGVFPDEAVIDVYQTGRHLADHILLRLLRGESVGIGFEEHVAGAGRDRVFIALAFPD